MWWKLYILLDHILDQTNNQLLYVNYTEAKIFKGSITVYHTRSERQEDMEIVFNNNVGLNNPFFPGSYNSEHDIERFDWSIKTSHGH